MIKTKLNNILKERQLTAIELSELTGINLSSIYKYTCGQREPSVKNAKKIADVLKINWWLLFEQ